MSDTHPFLPSLGRRLVLASQSPRRADILRAQGLDFLIIPPRLDESRRAGEEPGAFAERVAVDKALKVAKQMPDALCLGCDTIVLVEGELLGKPAGTAGAVRMLRRLSGRAHTVISALALVCDELGWRGVGHQSSEVRFRPLGEEEIERYVASGEPLDKAGAYGIQGWGALMVEGIEGCYFNVMGLPLGVLREQWRAFCRAHPSHHKDPHAS